MKAGEIIKGPGRLELLSLRIMILIGIFSMFYFIYELLNPDYIGYRPFYYILIGTIIFSCFSTLAEWYHYFSIKVPETPVKKRDYTVDILTTFCPGEPYEMIIETLEAILKVKYPHATYLCDEANDPFLKDFCEKNGIHHVTRTDKTNAKAGNINNALKQAKGELCVVMDPDHVPCAELLDPIIPHFSNPEIGFVQIVQAYKNFNQGLIAKGAAQQTFQFYGPMMMSMNSYGTVLAIGANCTFRRAALDSIGGHAAGLSEDMHTAMQLHAKGWKSVYVPAVLTRGLVPTTLSAYYKQQLKWARGTFELFVTSYINLFSKFTWRQKLHYGAIPFHYLSGLIYFFNFLLPVLSLSLAIIPMKLDMLRFLFLGIPVWSCTVLIRHYVQRWVMEEKERGFHLVGGLLQIGTWWIFMLGFIYTIIRKKVPYVPTPKDDNEPDPWALSFPNIIVGIASIAAIIYGLNLDYNPYSLVMAGLAGLNCLFMIFVVIASRQSAFRKVKKRYIILKSIFENIRKLKIELWWLRHGIYGGFRRMALPLILGFVIFSFYALNEEPKMAVKPHLKKLENNKNVLFAGIFTPSGLNGISSLSNVYKFQDKTNTHLDLISLYIPWGDGANARIPFTFLDSIYNNNSVPIITWEPWGSKFKSSENDPDLKSEKKIFSKILNGHFDKYIHEFARDSRSMNKPVFLRFAHEMDNPFYPWSATGNNDPEEFKAAWKYVREIFKKEGAWNVIWVYNPWKAESAEKYFPGKENCDWLSVTVLNYGDLNPDKNWYSFKELYQPFHKTKVFSSGMPVMIAEMGSLRSVGKQKYWLRNAFSSVKNEYSEIKAIVFFNSGYDRNIPGDHAEEMLDWRIKSVRTIRKAGKTLPEIKRNTIYFGEINAKNSFDIKAWTDRNLPDFKGINYTKGKEWFRNYHTLSRRDILEDFAEMKKLGINTIKIYGPSAYDRNIISISEEEKIKIHYAFWIPPGTNFTSDSVDLANLRKEITDVVKDLKDEPSVVSWNIGNTAIEDIERAFIKPELLYHRAAYAAWVQQLIHDIKEEDPFRPVTLDFQLAGNYKENIEFIDQQIPEADGIGIIVPDTAEINYEIPVLKTKYFYSKIKVDQYIKNQSYSSAFISEFQDIRTSEDVTFNGLIDHWRRKKPEYFSLAKVWGTEINIGNNTIPDLRVLIPAGIVAGVPVTYTAMIRKNDSWEVAELAAPEMKFEWFLVLNDEYGQSSVMQELGTGGKITCTLPSDPNQYRIYLLAVDGGKCRGFVSKATIWNKKD